jgi:hypothetical protein
LAGETIEIVDGDLFADGKRPVRRPLEREEMWIPVHDSGPCRSEGPPPSWKSSGHVVSNPLTGEWILSGPDGGLELERTSDDSFAYDAYFFKVRGAPTFTPVHDVRVEAQITTVKGGGGQAGSLVIGWKHAKRDVQAVVEESGRVRIEWPGGRAAGDLGAGTAGKQIAFQVRDGVVAVLAGGKEIASLEIGPRDFQEAGKIPSGVPCQVSLRTPAGAVGINGIRISRDIYYRKDPGSIAWPVRLGPRQFLILGDNCLMSFDSRFLGPCPDTSIAGVACWRFAPFSRSRFFE